MSMAVAALMFVLLLAVALAHFLWAMGNSWPIRHPAMLARAVIGRPGVTKVPRLASAGVSIAILAAGIVALALADHGGGGAGLTAIGALCALIFLGRGALGYTSWWKAMTPIEPFRTLDQRNYSPLCFAIGIGYVALVLMRLL